VERFLAEGELMVVADVIEMSAWKKVRCDDEPTSLRCTKRLHDGDCPGARIGRCRSSKLDGTKHNVALPKFFEAQH